VEFYPELSYLLGYGCLPFDVIKEVGIILTCGKKKTKEIPRFPKHPLSIILYCTASEMWWDSMESEPSRSAMVRETLKVLVYMALRGGFL